MGWAFAADIPLTSITKAEATNARAPAGTLIRAAGWSPMQACGTDDDPPRTGAALEEVADGARVNWVSVTDPELVTACTAK